MNTDSLVNNILKNFGGTAKNNLNEILCNIDDLDNDISIASDSPYIDSNNVVHTLKPFSHNFSVLALNIQSLNAKFDNLKILLDELASQDFEFSAICLQETWISGDQSNISFYNLDNYAAIPLPATCSSHGGLLIYLHKKFQYVLRDEYSPNHLWEGQFLDITGNDLPNKITLCNVYRAPRDRNEDIESFINDLMPIVTTMSNERSDKLIVGDFNSDMLKINTRERGTSKL